MTGDFKDKTSSLKVYKNTVLGSSIGRWVSLITATETINYSSHYGFSGTTKETDTSMMKYTLDYELSIGVKFEVENVSETVKESYTTQITHETQTSYT